MACEEGKQYAVLLGRETWESIPAEVRPLPGRVMVVLTRAGQADPAVVSPYPEGVLVAPSVASALEKLSKKEDVESAFVIGGQAAYQEAMEMAACSRIFITRIAKDVECDVFFPAFDDAQFKVVHVSQTQSHKDMPYDFVVYERLNIEPAAKARLLASPAPLTAAGGAGQLLHEEYQYLDAIREIIEKGIPMSDRTGVGTVSMFGKMMRFDLRKSFPLLTTKRVFWRGVMEELLWFVKGDTNAKNLSDKGIKIWDGNGSREFLDKRGLSHREEMDLGPVYGFQWRHFGAKYVDMHTDYTGQGVDQLADCIRKIKEDPTTAGFCCRRGTPRILARWPCRRATCSASSTWRTASCRA